MARDPARIATNNPVDPLRAALSNMKAAHGSAKKTAEEIAAQRSAETTTEEGGATK